MLHEFLTANRAALIDRCREMVAERSAPQVPTRELVHGFPVFLDQVITTLTFGQSDQRRRSVQGTVADNNPDVCAMAVLHGRDLLREGFTLEQVIRDYGDVCQAVTSLASETGSTISCDEFHTFNRCLDDAIAAAVCEYSRRKAAATAAALTASQQETREALARSLRDSLTGLPNRELFDDRLAKAISLARRHDWTLAVMFLDLDHFKRVNDAHGHATGDLVLKAIAERLLRYVRDEDTVCRNGGDEFLYLLMNPGGKVNLERIADSVLQGIALPVVVGDQEFAIRPSIGIALYPDDGDLGNELIRNADAAMYSAKKRSRGVTFFDSSVRGPNSS